MNSNARGSGREALAVATGVGLLLGGLDAGIGLTRGTAASWTALLPFLAVTAACGAAACTLLCLLAGGFRRRPPRARAVAAALVGLPLVLVLLRWYEKPGSRVEPSMAVLLGVLGIGLAGGFRSRRQEAEPRLRPEALLLAVVFAAGSFCLLRSLRASRWPPSPGAAALAVASAAAVAAAAVWLRRGRGRRVATLALPLLFLAALASPLLLRGAQELWPPTPPGTLRSGHAVPRVLLIVADTLRGDALSTVSPHAPPTPALDDLAASSFVFEHAVAPAAWTLPSVATLLTGVSPLVHGAVHWNSKLPSAVPTLAQRLAGEGYRTAAFGHNGSLLPASGISRGFQDYAFSPWPRVDAPLGAFLMRHLLPGVLPQKAEGAQLTGMASRWLEEHAGEDFFLWVHYFDVHLPYIPPPGFLAGQTPPPGMQPLWYDLDSLRLGHVVLDAPERRWLKVLYDAEVRALDAQVGRLLGTLKDLGIYADTLIVFASDHGEEFWEHGGFEHGHSLHDEVTWVPLMIKLPGQAGCRRVPQRVAVERLAATLLSLCGVAYDPGLLTGPPLVAEESAQPGEDAAIVSSGNLNYEPRVSVVHAGLKYLHFEVSGREEFYDLARDPGEQRPLLDPAPDVVERARQLYQDAQRAAAALRQKLGIGPAEHGALDAAAEEELRALGYIR